MKIKSKNIKGLPSVDYKVKLAQTQKELRELKEQYRLFTETSPDAVLILREEKIVFVNKAGARIYGAARPEDLIGKSFLGFVHPDYRESVKERILRLKAGKKIPIVEKKFVRVDGKAIDVEVIATPLFLNDGPAAQVIARDITERKIAQQKIWVQKEFTERILNSSFDGILAFDTQCRYTLWNPGMERITGISKKKVLNKSAFDVFPFIKTNGSDKFLYDTLAGKTFLIEDRPYKVGNKSGFVEARYSPIYDENNKVIGGLVIVHDITEFKKTLKILEDKNVALREVLNQIDKGKVSSQAEQVLMKLSPSEIRIANMIKQGLPNKEISRLLKISPLTIGTHRNRMRKKLGLSRDVNLTVYLQTK